MTACKLSAYTVVFKFDNLDVEYGRWKNIPFLAFGKKIFKTVSDAYNYNNVPNIFFLDAWRKLLEEPF